MAAMAPPLVDVLRSAASARLVDRNGQAIDTTTGANVTDAVNAHADLFAGPDATDTEPTLALSDTGWRRLDALGGWGVSTSRPFTFVRGRLA